MSPPGRPLASSLVWLLIGVALYLGGCKEDEPAGPEPPAAGDSDGDAGYDDDGEAAGDSDGDAGYDDDGEAAGDSDGDAGYDDDGDTGGDSDGDAGYDDDGDTGGGDAGGDAAGGDAGGDDGGGDATGGDAGGGDGGGQTLREIGEPCTADPDCVTSLCLTELVNGYCSADCVCIDCAEKVPCPQGSHPVRLYLGEYVCRCMELCLNADDCQPEYTCSLRNGANVCLPPT